MLFIKPDERAMEFAMFAKNSNIYIEEYSCLLSWIQGLEMRHG